MMEFQRTTDGTEMIASLQKIRLAAASMGQAVLEFPEWMTRSDPDYEEGERLFRVAQYAEAETCFQTASSKIRPRPASRGHQAQVLLALSRAQWKQGKLKQAEETGESARELLDAAKKATSGLAACLDLLGSIREDSGDAEQARKLFREALETQEKVFPVVPQVLIQRYMRLAKSFREVQPREALDLLKRTVEAAEKHLGTHAPGTADCLIELGQLQIEQGEKELGVASMERAVEIHRETHGPFSEEVARDYHCLASACHTAGDLERAVQYYERALSIRERQVGGSGPDLAILMMGLADV